MKKRATSLELSSIFMLILLGTVAFVVVTPLLLTILASFQLSRPGEPPVFGLSGWARLFNDPSLLSAMANTVLLAVTYQAIALVVGILLSWLLARTDLPFKKHLEFMFWVAFLLPPLPMTMGWILLLDKNFGLLNKSLEALPFVGRSFFDIYSFWGITWVHLSTTALSSKVLVLVPAFRNMNAELEEASHASGASVIGTVLHIVVPVMAPAIILTMVLGLIRSLEAFEIELLLGVPIGLHVYSTKIYDFITVEPPQYAPATALGTVFLFILLLLVGWNRWFTGGKSYTTVTGRSFTTRPIPLGRWRFPIFGVIVALVVMMTVAPVVVLIMGTFMTIFGFFDIPDPWTLRHWQRVLTDPLMLSSIHNTIIVGTGAAVFGSLLYGLIAYVVVKTRLPGRVLLDFICWLPWAIPGILISLALLWTVFETKILIPLYGTVNLLILAMVIKSMPVGVQLTRAVLLQIHKELEEASLICGGSWLQTYLRIIIPLLRPSLIVVMLLAFASAARDISTVVLLGTAHSRTLALLALDYATSGQFEKGAVAALMTAGIVIIAALVSVTLGGRLDAK